MGGTVKPSWHDPEARQILEERKAQRDNEYLLKQIGEATYLRSLLILGYSMDDARAALAAFTQADGGGK